MKKTISLLSILCATLILCSCKVNWFTTTVDVPWYFVVIPIVIIIVVSYIMIINRTYICPECGTEFKPKWYQISIALHFMGKRVAKCPKCKRKGFCERKK